MKKNKEFLYKYLNAYSPVGQEEEGQAIWRDYVEEFASEMYTDAYGTSVGTLLGIRVKRHGGSDNMIAPSKTVMIHTHKGTKVNGVFGWPAIHTRKAFVEMGPDQHELWVDTGLSNKKAVKKAGVEVGNLITFDDQFHEMGDF